mmetsp:Transcript_22977/g.77632  ORF Transcript_22977/g.77632 Transcript_22977/m.77632 type:complete len:404 (-) Transcript_22977:1008-2219(-)
MRIRRARPFRRRPRCPPSRAGGAPLRARRACRGSRRGRCAGRRRAPFGAPSACPAARRQSRKRAEDEPGRPCGAAARAFGWPGARLNAPPPPWPPLRRRRPPSPARAARAAPPTRTRRACQRPTGAPLARPRRCRGASFAPCGGRRRASSPSPWPARGRGRRRSSRAPPTWPAQERRRRKSIGELRTRARTRRASAPPRPDHRRLARRLPFWHSRRVCRATIPAFGIIHPRAPWTRISRPCYSVPSTDAGAAPALDRVVKRGPSTKTRLAASRRSRRPCGTRPRLGCKAVRALGIIPQSPTATSYSAEPPPAPEPRRPPRRLDRAAPPWKIAALSRPRGTGQSPWPHLRRRRTLGEPCSSLPPLETAARGPTPWRWSGRTRSLRPLRTSAPACRASCPRGRGP